jgi:hypothetical protein
LDIACLAIACLKLGFRLQVVLAFASSFSIFDLLFGKLPLIVLDFPINFIKLLRQYVHATSRVIKVTNIDVNRGSFTCFVWQLNIFSLDLIRDSNVITAFFFEVADNAKFI